MLVNRYNPEDNSISHHLECNQSVCFCYALDERDYFINTVFKIYSIHNSNQVDYQCSCHLCQAYLTFVYYRENLYGQSTPSTNQ